MGIAGHGVQRAYDYNLQTVQNIIPYQQPFIISGIIETNSDTYKLCSLTTEIQILPFNYLSTAQTITVSSTSDNDTALGTGCRSVIVFGMDSNYNLQQFFTFLDGKNPVTIATDWIRVHEVACLTFGNNVDALGDKEIDGTIYIGYGTVTDGKPANVLLSVFGTDPNSRTAIFTVPDGYTMSISKIDMSNSLAVGGSDYTTGRLCIRNIPDIDSTLQLPEIDCYGGKEKKYDVPLILPSRTDIEFRVKNNVPQTQKTSVEITVSLLEVLI